MGYKRRHKKKKRLGNCKGKMRVEENESTATRLSMSDVSTLIAKLRGKTILLENVKRLIKHVRP